MMVGVVGDSGASPTVEHADTIARNLLTQPVRPSMLFQISAPATKGTT